MFYIKDCETLIKHFLSKKESHHEPDILKVTIHTYA